MRQRCRRRRARDHDGSGWQVAEGRRDELVGALEDRQVALVAQAEVAHQVGRLAFGVEEMHGALDDGLVDVLVERAFADKLGEVAQAQLGRLAAAGGEQLGHLDDLGGGVDGGVEVGRQLVVGHVAAVDVVAERGHLALEVLGRRWLGKRLLGVLCHVDSIRTGGTLLHNKFGPGFARCQRHGWRAALICGPAGRRIGQPRGRGGC